MPSSDGRLAKRSAAWTPVWRPPCACCEPPADVDKPVEFIDGGGDYLTIRRLVGGWLEAIGGITATETEWRAYVDDEGCLNGLPINSRAMVLAEELGWPVELRYALHGPPSSSA